MKTKQIMNGKISDDANLQCLRRSGQKKVLFVEGEDNRRPAVNFLKRIFHSILESKSIFDIFSVDFHFQ